MNIFRNVKLLLVLIVVLILSGAVYAFTAANTIPQSYLGEGAGTISGYTVSNIQYTMNATNPSNLDAVSFDLDSAATTVIIRVVAGGTDFYTCAGGPTSWTCDTTSPQATVLAADELTVIAGQ